MTVILHQPYTEMSTPESSTPSSVEAGDSTVALARGFVVAWAYRDGRARGHGNPTDRETARAWADYGNRKYPDISHRVVPAQ